MAFPYSNLHTRYPKRWASVIGPLGGFFLIGFDVTISFTGIFNGGPAMESYFKRCSIATTFLVGLGPVTKPRPLENMEREHTKIETVVCLLKVGQRQVWSWETELFIHIYLFSVEKGIQIIGSYLLQPRVK